MIGHEAEGVDAVTEPAGSFLEEEIKTVPVIISEENGLTAVTPKDDVVKSTGEMDAWFASHVEIIPPSYNLSTWKPDPIFPFDPIFTHFHHFHFLDPFSL
jgi:hypothetical protein